MAGSLGAFLVVDDGAGSSPAAGIVARLAATRAVIRNARVFIRKHPFVVGGEKGLGRTPLRAARTESVAIMVTWAGTSCRFAAVSRAGAATRSYRPGASGRSSLEAG